MKKITDFIVDKRYIIFTLFIILTIVCGILSQNVKINYDVANYLPVSSETRQGMNIMEDEFSSISTLNIMFENLSDEEKEKIKEELENTEGVWSVEYDESDKYNRENYTLYILSVNDSADSKVAKDVYNTITTRYEDNYTYYTSGDISSTNGDVLPFYIVVLAVACALVILIIMCNSYVEPFLFLFAILMAVVLNKGTNIMFSSVSNITDSIVAILQMALSMDYSIMLMNRYNQEKETEKDNVVAMKNALYKAFKAISSSSVTTIVGLLALVFMSFKIGKDLGFVLAKGVLFSLICIFFVLPALILLFDKLITRTKKKAPNIKLNKVGAVSYKMRYIALPVFIGVFIFSYISKGNLGINYTASEDDEISKVFDENNQMAIIYNNKDEEKVSKYLKELENTEKVEEVLGYGNTINEPLTYDSLVPKLEELGVEDIDVKDYMLRIVYYDYYMKNNEDNEKLDFSSLVEFIEKEVYNNDIASKKITPEIKKDITRLKNFVTLDEINKERDKEEISNILEVDVSQIKDVMIYYLSKNNNSRMSISDFVSFMNNTVIPDEKYGSMVGVDNISRLNTLSKFSNYNTVSSRYNSNDMSKLFNINEKDMDALYDYYILNSDINEKMSFNTFSNFVLQNVVNNSEYSSYIDENTLSSINILNTLSNTDTILKPMTNTEISSIFGISEEDTESVNILKHIINSSNTRLSLSQTILDIINLKRTTNYLDNIDTTKLESIEIFAKNENNLNTTKMTKEELNSLFGEFKEGFVGLVYIFGGVQNDTTFTPQEFIALTQEICNKMPGIIDENTLKELNVLKLVIDDSIEKNEYNKEELANILGIDENSMSMLFGLISYYNSDKTITPYDFVSTIISNKEMDEIKNKLDESTINKLETLYLVMVGTINNESYTYSDIARITGMDENVVKSIYTLYISNNYTISPYEFVTFVLNHSSDNVLSGRIESNTINDLKLLKNVIEGVLNNTKYSSIELSNLLGIDNNELSLVYGLYSYNDEYKISLKNLVSFMLSDLVTNNEFSSYFNDNSINMLNAVNDIMQGVEENIKYTSDEMYLVIQRLTNIIDKNTIDMLYTYYGSTYSYNNTWVLTIEEFVRYLNESIISDVKFIDYIDSDLKESIIDAKDMITDAKKLVVGNTHSRIVLNTNFDAESDETFSFIDTLREKLNSNLDEVYVIGNSPMSCEIDKTFGRELNFITVITMIAIFIVVAFTFKSLTTPTILVLIIQTAVYLTMGILSFVGEDVYFISVLIVQSILMGATIDYAILYTSYYIEFRKNNNIKDSIIGAYNNSINTIITSSSILIIVTLIVAKFTSAIASKICKTISEGTLCSTILILTLLPSILAFCDRVIVKKKDRFKEKETK